MPALLLIGKYQPKTVTKYLRGVRAFVNFCEQQSLQPWTTENMDDCLCQFIQQTFDRYEGMNRSLAAGAVYGVPMLLPRLAKRLPVARRYLDSWQVLKPSRPRPPFTKDVISAVAMRLALNGYPRYALAALLQFDCLLRVSELMNLKASDVAFQEDARLGSGFQDSKVEHAGVCVSIRKAKTGRNQSVLVVDKDVATLLRFAMKGLKPSDMLFPAWRKDRADCYREKLLQACKQLGLSADYNTHSLRHGGATHLFIKGWKIADIMQRGRWKSSESADRYIQAGRSLLMQQQVPSAVAQAGAVVSRHLVACFSLAQVSRSGVGLSL
jgi:integrase